MWIYNLYVLFLILGRMAYFFLLKKNKCLHTEKQVTVAKHQGKKR